MDKLSVLSEIKPFLEGYNDELKYLVNVETDNNTNVAECVIHEPNKEPRIVKIQYEPFLYMKDLGKTKHTLYEGHTEEYMLSKQIKYGISITKLKTGNQKRLVNGYCFKLTSKKSYNDIINYIRDGGINPYEKLVDDDGRVITDAKGDPIYPYRDLFTSVKGAEQFLISNQTRLFKGFEEYKDVHKLTFDIETTGLRYQIARIFAIGVRDNRGFETILESDKLNDDESEIRLIQDFFNLIHHLKPAVISGYNSEFFDFEFIIGRAKVLKMNLDEVPTSLKDGIHLRRRPNCSVKYGNTADKFTATEMWGYSVIDIIHAAKKTAAVNTEIKATGLKYIAKHEKIAKPNRTYIKGEDNSIGRFYAENKMFVINETNTYIKVPSAFQEIARKMYSLQATKAKLKEEHYKVLKAKFFNSDPKFVEWLRKEAIPNGMTTFISGKNLVKQYLLDDLWETEQVDELYNQSSFMLAKIIPTTYQRVCTMGTAAIWNLLLTTWSYENDLAIPICDRNEKFSGGLARCYKVGFSRRIKKIDYASLYPMIQLSDDVFPIFDITGVIKKLLLYLTTTRNIYKKLANSDKLNEEEVTLLKEIDHEVHIKYINNTLSTEDRAMFKIKQLPIKILNNSLFGALGSAISFNWSDNVCAARITCTGRLHLRHAIDWFTDYDCVALLAVTDGINFNYPEKTRIRVTDDGQWTEAVEGDVEEMWQYGGKKGLNALIEKYNAEEMVSPYMSVDDDGDSISCLNLSRINYATLSLAKDKKTKEMKEKVKLTGNTIKSKTMPEYIEDFIDKGLTMILHGQGKEFVEYYYDYCDNIRYMQIPLKKIASKSKVKISLSAYKKRGLDKNGREKGIQAHMELLIEKRNKIADELFEQHKESLNLTKIKKELTSEDKLKIVANYMPPEPELDSVVYYVNSGTRKSHGDSRKIVVNKETGEERFCATLIDNNDLIDNPNMTGVYNYEKYLAAFNKRVESILVGFDPEIQKKIIVKIAQKDDKKGETKRGDLIKAGFGPDDLVLKNFDNDDYNESMYLEEMEVNFWNKTGYDPRLVWNKFKMKSDYKVHYEIYEGALNYLNEKMKANNKPLIKSINEKYGNGDLVLIKDGIDYHLGAYNGTYLQIIRENVEVPKSELELELDRKRIESEKKLEELRINELDTDTDRDKLLKAMNERRQKHFIGFKQKFGIPLAYSMEQVFEGIENSQDVFDDYVFELDGKLEDEAVEYIDVDENDVE